jgi:serine/threonine-protein kinase
MLEGEQLFAGDNEANVLERVLFAEVGPPGRGAGDVPADLDAIVLRALARNPARRYSTAREMARAIETAIPVASAAEVGEWVEALAGESLLERARKTARIESGSSVPIEERSARPDPSAGDASGVATVDGELRAQGVSADRDDEPSSGTPRPARARFWRPLVLVFAAVAIAALTIALVTHRGLAGGSVPVARAVADLPSPVREPMAPPSATPVTDPPAEIAASAVSSQVLVPARRVVVDVPPKSASPPPSARARPVRPVPAKPSCDPPWTLDDGVKKYKLECL